MLHFVCFVRHCKVITVQSSNCWQCCEEGNFKAALHEWPMLGWIQIASSFCLSMKKALIFSILTFFFGTTVECQTSTWSGHAVFIECVSIRNGGCLSIYSVILRILSSPGLVGNPEEVTLWPYCGEILQVHLDVIWSMCNSGSCS